MPLKKSRNYLDFVPAINPRNTWSQDGEGRVTIHMVHRGFYAAVAQKFFHAPRVSHIALDEYGSFIWKSIDGSKSVGVLALEFRERFGEDAEPLYERLVKYMQILYNNKFILLTSEEKTKAGGRA